MPFRPVLLLCLLLALPLLGCAPDAEPAAPAKVDEDLKYAALRSFHETATLLRASAGIAGQVEQGALPAGMTPEAALDALEARVDARCFRFERTSPTSATLREDPLHPVGCVSRLGFNAQHVLRTGHGAGGDLHLLIEVTQHPGFGDWWIERTFPAAGGAPRMRTGAPSATTGDRLLLFDGTAQMDVTLPYAQQRLLVSGSGSTSSLERVWNFRAESLDLPLGTGCRPKAGRIELQGLTDANGRSQDVALGFAPDQLEVTVGDATETGYFSENMCNCGKQLCGSPL